jgi:hypothetical protein
VLGGTSKDSTCAPPPAPRRPLPVAFSVGDSFTADIPGDHRLHYTAFDVQHAVEVVFNVTLPVQGRLVVYGRRTVRPTPAEYDFTQVVIGRRLYRTGDVQTLDSSRRRRSSDTPVC